VECAPPSNLKVRCWGSWQRRPITNNAKQLAVAFFITLLDCTCIGSHTIGRGIARQLASYTNHLRVLIHFPIILVIEMKSSDSMSYAIFYKRCPSPSRKAETAPFSRNGSLPQKRLHPSETAVSSRNAETAFSLTGSRKRLPPENGS
jgi:hypothetical protein